jgi:hypothetical protein
MYSSSLDGEMAGVKLSSVPLTGPNRGSSQIFLISGSSSDKADRDERGEDGAVLVGEEVNSGVADSANGSVWI